jgi:(p)ppGpp synthase/HD superfamily hydrolase
VSTLERAIVIAAEAHAGQVDKAGAPYILHVLRVMLRLSGQAERIAGVLHDTLEDTPWTVEQLRAQGFAEEILVAIQALTKAPGEDYEAFVRRAGQNTIARRVKLADLADNSDLGRLPNPSAADLERIAKYQRAIALLRALDQ